MLGIIETVIVVRLVYKHRLRIAQGIENTCEYSLRDTPGESGLTERQVDALLAHKKQHVCTILPCPHCGSEVIR